MAELVARGDRGGPMFSTPAVAVITFLFTSCVVLIIALVQATQPTSYDRDQAFIKASIAENTQNIKDLTSAVSSLTIEVAQLQTKR